VICTPIIPDGDVVFAPLEPHLHIMIMRHQIEKVVQKDITFNFRDVIDVTHMVAHRENRLPSCDRVGADYLSQW